MVAVLPGVASPVPDSSGRKLIDQARFSHIGSTGKHKLWPITVRQLAGQTIGRLKIRLVVIQHLHILSLLLHHIFQRILSISACNGRRRFFERLLFSEAFGHTKATFSTCSRLLMGRN